MRTSWYLVSYDVSDDRRRTALFDMLMGMGDHLQYSVFVCELSRTEVVELRARAEVTIDHSRDQVVIVNLGPSANPLDGRMNVIGLPYKPLVRTIVI